MSLASVEIGSSTTSAVMGAAKMDRQPFAGLVSSFATAANPERREEPGVTPRRDGGVQFRRLPRRRSIPSTGRGRGGRRLDFAARGALETIIHHSSPRRLRFGARPTPLHMFSCSRFFLRQFRVDARVARERPLGRDLQSAASQQRRRGRSRSLAFRFCAKANLCGDNAKMATGKDLWQGGKTPRVFGGRNERMKAR